jgi:hypothetical protein
MKKFNCILLLILLGSSAFVFQKKFPAKSFYAARQEIKRGKNDGNKPRPAPQYNYFVFIEEWPGETVTVKKLWLQGKEVEFLVEAVPTPVLVEKSIQLFAGKPSYDTLIAATTNTVKQIRIKNALPQSSVMPAGLKNFELLVAYEANQKIYFVGSRTFKKLVPLTGR